MVTSTVNYMFLCLVVRAFQFPFNTHDVALALARRNILYFLSNSNKQRYAYEQSLRMTFIMGLGQTESLSVTI